MKRFKIIFTFILAALFSAIGFSQIAGSAHDFSTASWNSTGETCIVCHTPHNASAEPNAPLWDHQLTTSTFTLYTSPSLDAVIGQPSGSSKLCLSCHDGTIALDNFGGTTTGTEFITGAFLIGTDLSNDHPISFTYDASLATSDGGLFDPTTALSGLGSTINNDLLLAGQMQCSSCHDVHNAGGFDKLLVKSNAGSALCLTCHNK